MKTSKLTSIYILLGVLIFTSILSVPVQAKSVQPGNQQQSSELAGKPPTKTRRPKSTPVTKKSPTPKPANTATKASTSSANTPVPTIAVTESSTGTVIPTTSVTVTAKLSPTPTAFGTAAAHLTQTSVVVAKTATSSALTASPTPTIFGSLTFTPNSTEQTANSFAISGTPTGADSQSTLVAAPGSSTDPQIPLTSGQSTVNQRSRKMFWMLEVGLIVLLVLFYLLGRELKKSSPKSR